jgi:hypothetical protein
MLEGLYTAPTRKLFEAMDGRRGRPVYVFPPYEANDFLKRSSKTLAVAVGSFVVALVSLALGPFGNPCFVIGVLLFIGLTGLVLLNHRWRGALVVYQDGIRFAGMDLRPINFYSVDVYPQVSDLFHGDPKGGYDFDVKPFYEFLFTLDVGGVGDAREVSVALICKERGVERHLGEMHRHMPGMRIYFHRDMGPDTGPVARTVLRAMKGPKDFFKIRLP